MGSKLMTNDELVAVTGRKRYSKQVAWFREQFGVTLPCAVKGAPVITWAAFEALQAKRNGTGGSVGMPPARPALRAIGGAR